jgi:hypothetical protein
MEITNRAAFQALREAGLGSDVEIRAWMNTQQQANLRDQFAMHAPPPGGFKPDDQPYADFYAEWAYAFADTMLRERVKS